LVLPVAVASGCGNPDKAGWPWFLFSIPAAAGSVVGPGDADLTLRLTGARSYLTQFSDRPVRETFDLANSEFARQFPAWSSTPTRTLCSPTRRWARRFVRRSS